MKAAFGAMSNAVLGNTYDLQAAAFSRFDRTVPAREVFGLPGQPSVEAQARHINPYKYSVEATPPQIDFPAGTARTTKAALWPILRDIAMYSVTISEKGMREPHWHPETAEMGYVAAGKARMTILDPDGSTDTYIIGPGDAYFIPPAYPHHIENVGEETFHVLIFFDQVVARRHRLPVADQRLSPQVACRGFRDGRNRPLRPSRSTQIDPLLVPRTNPIDPLH